MKTCGGAEDASHIYVDLYAALSSIGFFLVCFYAWSILFKRFKWFENLDAKVKGVPLVMWQVTFPFLIFLLLLRLCSGYFIAREFKYSCFCYRTWFTVVSLGSFLDVRGGYIKWSGRGD